MPFLIVSALAISSWISGYFSLFLSNREDRKKIALKGIEIYIRDGARSIRKRKRFFTMPRRILMSSSDVSNFFIFFHCESFFYLPSRLAIKLELGSGNISSDWHRIDSWNFLINWNVASGGTQMDVTSYLKRSSEVFTANAAAVIEMKRRWKIFYGLQMNLN